MVDCGSNGIVPVNEIIVAIQAGRPFEKINIWKGHCVRSRAWCRCEIAAKKTQGRSRWIKADGQKGTKAAVFLLPIGDIGLRGFSPAFNGHDQQIETSTG